MEGKAVSANTGNNGGDETVTRSKDSAVLDLTVGSPILRILIFSVPLVCGSFVQQIYNFADVVVVVVGRLISSDALGAVGATYSLDFLILGFIQGACIGLSIPAAQSFGAKKASEFRRHMWNGLWVGLIIAAVFTVSFVLLTRPLLLAMGTPRSLLEMAVTYIIIDFIGIPAAVIYNYSAAILRAVGDSKHPFYFLVFSCAINIACDITFYYGISHGCGRVCVGDCDWSDT